MAHCHVILSSFTNQFVSELTDDTDDVFFYDKIWESCNGIDLKDAMVYFKIIDQFEFELDNSFKPMMNWMNTFSCNQRDLSDFDVFDLCPPAIIKKSLSNRNAILLRALTVLRCLPCFEQFLEAYRANQHMFDVLKKLHFEIKTTAGQKEIFIDFAQNFRFKSRKDHFNLFTLPKDKRSMVIPQKDDHFLFVIDFKQFEFRTFLMLCEADVDFAHPDIYAMIAKMTGKSREDAKIYALKAIYDDVRHDELTLFDKNRILNNIHNEIFQYEEWPIHINADWPDNKKMHTIIQTISQFHFLDRLSQVFQLLENKKSSFIFPLHDSMIFSMNESEKFLMKEIKDVLETDIYKIKQFTGQDLSNLKEV